MNDLLKRLGSGDEIHNGDWSMLDDAIERIKSQAAEIDRLETLVDQLQWENKGVAEWQEVALNYKKQRDEYKALCDLMASALQDVIRAHDYESGTPVDALGAWRNSK